MLTDKKNIEEVNKAISDRLYEFGLLNRETFANAWEKIDQFFRDDNIYLYLEMQDTYDFMTLPRDYYNYIQEQIPDPVFDPYVSIYEDTNYLVSELSPSPIEIKEIDEVEGNEIGVVIPETDRVAVLPEDAWIPPTTFWNAEVDPDTIDEQLTIETIPITDVVPQTESYHEDVELWKLPKDVDAGEGLTVTHIPAGNMIPMTVPDEPDSYHYDVQMWREEERIGGYVFPKEKAIDWKKILTIVAGLFLLDKGM